MNVDEVRERSEKAARAREKLKRFKAAKLALASKTASEGSSTPTALLSPVASSSPPPRSSQPPPPFASLAASEERLHSPPVTPLHFEAAASLFASPPRAAAAATTVSQALAPAPALYSRLPPSSATAATRSPPLAPRPSVLPSSTANDLVQSQREAITLLVSEKATLVHKVRELEQELDQSSAYNGAQNSSTTTEAEAMRNELEQLRHQFARADEELRQRRAASSNEERQAEISRGMVADLQLQLSSREATLQEVQSELAELHSSSTISDLESRLRSKSDHADALELELSKAKSLAAKFRSEKEELEARSISEGTNRDATSPNVAAGKLGSWSEESSKASLELKSLRKQLEDEEASRLATYEKLSSARSSLSAMTASSQHSQSQLAAALARIASLESSSSTSDHPSATVLDQRINPDQQETHAPSSLEMDNLRSRFDELCQHYEVVRAEKAELESEVNHQGERTMNLERQLAESRDVHSEHQRQTASLEEALATAQDSAARTDAALVTIEQLQRQLAAATAVVSDLEHRSTLSTLPQPSYPDLSDHVKSLESALASKETGLISLQEQLDASRAESAQLNEFLTSANEETLNTRDDLLSEIEELKEERETMRSSYQSITQRESNLAQEIVDFEKALAARVQEIDLLKAALSTMSDDLDAARKELSLPTEDSFRIGDLEAEIARFGALDETRSKRIDELEMNLDSSSAAVSNLEHQLQQSSDAFDRLQSDHAQVVASNQQLSASLEQLQSTANDTNVEVWNPSSFIDGNPSSAASNQDQQSEIEALRNRIREIESAREDIEHASISIRETVDRVTAELHVKEEELVEKRTQVGRLEEVLRSNEAQSQDAFSRCGDLERQNNALQQSLEGLQIQIDSLASLRNEAEEELTTLRASIANDRGQALDTEMAIASDQHMENDELRRIIAVLEERVMRVRGESETSLDEVKNLSSELERNVGEVESLKVTLERHVEDAEEASKAFLELKEVLMRTQEDLAIKQEEVEDLKLRPSRPASPSSPVDNRNGTLDPSTHPYNREYVDGIQRQHGVDLADARSQIRKLEERVLASETKEHAMSKEADELKSSVHAATEALQMKKERRRVKEKEVDSLRALSVDQSRLADPRNSPARHLPSHASRSSIISPLPSPRSPPPAPATSARVLGHRRIASHMPALSENVAPGTATGFPFHSPSDQPRSSNNRPSMGSPSINAVPARLAAATRHARQASLVLLKSRIDDEAIDAKEGEKKLRTAVMNDELMNCICCAGDLYIV